MRTRRLLSISLALAAVLLPGCSSPELTKSQFVERAEEVCDEAADGWKELRGSGVGVDTEAEFAQLFEQELRMGAELGSQVLNGLQGLNPPAADEREVASMLEALDRTVALADRYADALESGDEAELDRLNEETDDSDFESFQEKAKSYGLDGCAQGRFLSPWEAMVG